MAEFTIIIKYPTSMSGMIDLSKTPLNTDKSPHLYFIMLFFLMHTLTIFLEHSIMAHNSSWLLANENS